MPRTESLPTKRQYAAAARSEAERARIEPLRDKNPTVAYALNVILPGLGCCLYGRPLMGSLLMLLTAVAILLFFVGSLAGTIGMIVVIVSIVGAFFTFGVTLLFLPIGLIMLFMGASPLVSVFIYIFGLIVSEILVGRTAEKVSALTTDDRAVS
ncbi:MAG: hypothetical protein ABL957_14800 [Parvularculaceae bacterium]